MKLKEGVRVAVDLGKCWYMLCNYAGQGEGWLLVMTKGYVFNKEPANLVQLSGSYPAFFLPIATTESEATVNWKCRC
jgi:hypothetical protein